MLCSLSNPDTLPVAAFLFSAEAEARRVNDLPQGGVQWVGPVVLIFWSKSCPVSSLHSLDSCTQRSSELEGVWGGGGWRAVGLWSLSPAFYFRALGFMEQPHLSP